MSRSLQISLMILTAALCGVCVLQWLRESRMAAQAAGLEGQLVEARRTQESQKTQLANWEQEIGRLHQNLSVQMEAAHRVPELEAAAAAARQELDALKTATAGHQTTVDTLNQQVKKVLDERDALAGQLNERTKAFNALAEKYRKAQ